MHIPTHILSGWCVGVLAARNRRERACCMIAAAVADLDGLGIVIDWIMRSPEPLWYWRFHHVLGHNFFAGVIIALVLWALSGRRWIMAGMYLLLFHLHLAMDVVGSGPGWTIAYLWPVSDLKIAWEGAWDLSSWQNQLAMGILLIWTLLIAGIKRITPREWIAPRLDKKVAGAMRKMLRFPNRLKESTTSELVEETR